MKDYSCFYSKLLAVHIIVKNQRLQRDEYLDSKLSGRGIPFPVKIVQFRFRIHLHIVRISDIFQA